jgi:hypothetical protein
MSRARLALVLLAVAVAAAVGLRVATVEAKQTLSHDETISLLAATCHQAEYEAIAAGGAPPVAQWVAAAEWQQFLEPTGALCPARLSEGLALYDIHPPLYFWLLNAWTLVVGVGVAAPALLNLVFVPLTALALFGLGRRVLGDPLEAAFAATLWAVSPAVVAISSEARQYDLLALVAVLFVWQAIRLAEAPPGRTGTAAVLLAVLAAAGALTHYHFALVAVAGAGVLALGLRRSRRAGRTAGARRRFVLGLGAIAAGYGGFWLAHPGFASSFARQEGQAGEFVLAGLGPRLDRTVTALAEFVVGKLATPAVGYALVGAAVALGLAAALRASSARRSDRARGSSVLSAGPAWGERPRAGRSGAPPSDFASASVLAVLAWLAGATIVLYLAFVSPINAMGGRYLATVWPLLALAVTLALRRVGGLRPFAGAALLAACVVFSSVQALSFERAAPRIVEPSPLEAERGALLVDTVRRGILPALLLGVPEDKPVFAAPQATLLARRPAWLPELDSRSAYASSTSYENMSYPRRRLLSDIRRALGSRRGVGSLRLWDPARPRGPHVIRLYRFADAGKGRRSAGRPEPGRQSRRRWIVTSGPGRS